MSKARDREYKIDIDPKILELLGPSLYTNIYYVLAELIANAYDAGASNVYIIEGEDKIIVEDDGQGMSYREGDIERYLGVAVETRVTKKDVYTADKKRRRMGRKGIGKLAALSVSERVLVMTKKNNELSGFVLSRHVNRDYLLEPIGEKDIVFEKVDKSSATSVVMTNPEYGLHKTALAIKKNLLKMFPLVNSEFRIHILTEQTSELIDSFDKEMITELGALHIFGKKYHRLSEYFDPHLQDRQAKEALFRKDDPIVIPLTLEDKKGRTSEYDLEIKGWLGAYRSTSGRKKNGDDFPDNFISLLSNGKLGEYNILPIVGKNLLTEVYIVGQLHVDLFEETSLPDMALSNRQGYKTDDSRHEAVIAHVRNDLLPAIISTRDKFVDYNKKKKNEEKRKRQKQDEDELKVKVDKYREEVSMSAVKKLEGMKVKLPKDARGLIKEEINKSLSEIVELKGRVDSQKKKILICHTRKDKLLADIIYKMLLFNGVPSDEIIYTSSENEESRVPESEGVFDYLRDFFVNSYSMEKIFVIYVTSNNMVKSWGAVLEVGAGWITRRDHKVFTIYDHVPRQPLDTKPVWHTSEKDGGTISMSAVEFDSFAVKIIDVCEQLGYAFKNKEDNKKELEKRVSVGGK